MGKIVSIINQKGGVGKTTSAINIAASMAVAERQVLLLDFDPQGNASSGLGVSVDQVQGKTIYQALVGQCSMEEVIRESELPGLWVAPADQNLSGAEVELVGAIAREHKLKKALESIRDRFDFILIDCPPSLGLLTINALTASDSYLVPMQCEYFSLEGLSQLVSTAGLIQGALNPKLELEGILLTMFDSRNNLAHQVLDEVKRHFGDKLFQTVVPRNVKLSEAPSHGKPVLLYDIESKGAKAYLEITKELIERNLQKTRGPLVSAAAAVSESVAVPEAPAPAPVSEPLTEVTVLAAEAELEAVAVADVQPEAVAQLSEEAQQVDQPEPVAPEERQELATEPIAGLSAEAEVEMPPQLEPIELVERAAESEAALEAELQAETETSVEPHAELVSELVAETLAAAPTDFVPEALVAEGAVEAGPAAPSVN